MSNAIEILKSYDIIFCDVYGVIHDGLNVLPNVTQTFEVLRELNKRIIFISNAPRPKSYISEKFMNLGLKFFCNEIITSGDFFRDDYISKANPLYNGRGFILGKSNNKDITLDINFLEAEDLNIADFLLIVPYADTKQEYSFFEDKLKLARERNLPAICPNPDLVVSHGSSKRYTAGTFGKIYEDLGGSVVYYGKPSRLIFDYACKNLGIKPQNAIMVGDTLETDIQGAANFGVDSMLLLTGNANQKDIEKSLLKPTFILNTL